MISELEIIGRLLLGAFFGGVIGHERQSHGRAAGFRTQMIVCIASVLVMEVSEYFHYLATMDPSYVRVDPGRIAAGAITGVGFLGAGVIVKMGTTVQGLTTAACLWMVSAIGLAVGSGLYLAATVAFFLTMFSLVLLRSYERHTPRMLFRSLSVIAGEGFEEQKLIDVLKSYNAMLYSTEYEMDMETREGIYRYTVALNSSVSVRAVIDGISALGAVKKVIFRS